MHNSEVINDQKALEALPGVGRKTANVVRNVAFNEPTIAVDTHVFRLSNRTGMAKGKNVLEVEEKLLEVIPEKFATRAGNLLVLHGRYVCKARKPDCDNCPITQYCEYFAENF